MKYLSSEDSHECIRHHLNLTSKINLASSDWRSSHRGTWISSILAAKEREVTAESWVIHGCWWDVTERKRSRKLTARSAVWDPATVCTGKKNCSRGLFFQHGNKRFSSLKNDHNCQIYLTSRGKITNIWCIHLPHNPSIFHVECPISILELF